ncbi:hypothetical protein D3C73_1443570 [compost metagenome]
MTVRDSEHLLNDQCLMSNLHSAMNDQRHMHIPHNHPTSAAVSLDSLHAFQHVLCFLWQSYHQPSPLDHSTLSLDLEIQHYD